MAAIWTTLRLTVLASVFLIGSLLSSCLAATTSSPYADSYACTYEITIAHPLCDMTQDTTDNFDWLRKTSDDDTFTDPEPLVDHTYEVTHGHYLYAQTGIQTTGATGRLLLPTLQQNSQSQCLQFFYQIGGDNAGNLNMYQYTTSAGRPSTATWSMTEDTESQWIRGLYTISPQSDSYMVVFEAVAGTAQKTYFALDDVTVSDGECPFFDFNCTFESDECNFVQTLAPGDNQNWYRGKGSTSSTYTGPSIDHTTGTADGYYMYIEASYMSVGHTADMTSPVMAGTYDTNTAACLVFFYHMYGDTIGTLEVYMRAASETNLGDPVWSMTGNRGDRWRGAEVDVTIDMDFVVLFRGIRGASYDGDIALDDITVSRGEQCPGNHKPPPGDLQGTCDFEEIDICAYTQDDTDDADWLWQNRANQYVDFGPLVDHTTNSEFGFYLFLYGDVGHRRTARMISPSVGQQTSHSCLQFWFHSYGNDEQRLNVYCVSNPTSITDEDLLVYYEGNWGDRWVQSRVNIPTESTPCQIIFEGKTGIHSRDDLAIDDVDVYHSQQCPTFPSVMPETTTPPTTNSITCDFENDDNALCGWSQGDRDNFDWTRIKGPSPEYSSGPEVDHTTGTADGYYMLIDTYENLPSNGRGELRSALVAPSGSDRCFHFWYYMYGNNINFLNIYLVEYGNTIPIDPQVQLYGNIGQAWLEGLLDIPASTRSFNIIVEGTVGASSYGADIAIDDVSLEGGKCVATCDFDTNMCGYTQSDDNDFEWFRNAGPTGTDGTGPMADHTTGTDQGFYMYAETSQPRSPGDKARIDSPVINYFNDTYCMEFYYHMSGLDTATLVVYESGDYYPDNELARLTGYTTAVWNPYNVNIPKKYGPLMISFEATVGSSYRGDIAIDDVVLMAGPCSGYPMETMCNFEFGYMDCSFEQDDTDDADWMWFDALTTELPPIKMPGLGSFMYFSGNNLTAGSVAILKTPILTLRYNDHCLIVNYAAEEAMELNIVSEGLSGERTILKSVKKTQTLSTLEYTLTADNHANNYRIVLEATVGTDNKGMAAIDNVYVVFGYCGQFTGGQQGSSTDSGTTAAIVLGILVGVALLVFVALGILHYRKQRAEAFPPAAMSYKNGGNIDPVSSMSKEPGIDNPNYATAKISSEA
ncbi:MAM and LDL-receptor class A domain-containing protein 1-like [Diadema antillarum]|uniref:MAM and LDL-receptor class A domain-containing protein 1-like n=1 Tax=Diadema antillarum TaxID=105358 RepID=UPI003A8C2804